MHNCSSLTVQGAHTQPVGEDVLLLLTTARGKFQTFIRILDPKRRVFKNSNEFPEDLIRKSFTWNLISCSSSCRPGGGPGPAVSSRSPTTRGRRGSTRGPQFLHRFFRNVASIVYILEYNTEMDHYGSR